MEMRVRRFHMLHVKLEGDSIVLAPNIVDGRHTVSRGTVPIPCSKFHLELEVPMLGRRQLISPGDLPLFSQRLWKAYEDADMKPNIHTCETVLHIGNPPSINLNMGANDGVVIYPADAFCKLQCGLTEAMQVFDLTSYNVKLVGNPL